MFSGSALAWDTDKQPRRAGMSQLLLLQRGCTSIVCEGAAKPAAITSCLAAKKPPASKDTPKPLLRERQLQSSVISKGSVGSSNPVGRGPVLGFHSPCRSARVPGSAFPPALPLAHLRVHRPSFQGLHVVFSSTGSRGRVFGHAGNVSASQGKKTSSKCVT